MTLQEQVDRRTATDSVDRSSSAEALPVTIIKPSKSWVSLRLHELWEYRELLYFLTWRDIKVRYKQTVLGAAWAIIQPFFTMVVFSLFFGKLAGLPSDDIPYPIFSYAALVPWTFFANGTRHSAQSLLSQRSVIAKVYFPRLVIPISSVLSAFVDFLASFVVLIGRLIFYRVMPTWAVLTLPLLLIIGRCHSSEHISNIAIRVENLSKQYPSTWLSGQAASAVSIRRLVAQNEASLI